MSINWRKTVIVVLDIALAAYLVLAVTAFNEPDVKAKICTEVKIDINNDVTRGFLEKNDVKTYLQQQEVVQQVEQCITTQVITQAQQHQHLVQAHGQQHIQVQ